MSGYRFVSSLNEDMTLKQVRQLICTKHKSSEATKHPLFFGYGTFI